MNFFACRLEYAHIIAVSLETSNARIVMWTVWRRLLVTQEICKYNIAVSFEDQFEGGGILSCSY
jgi:hypothetical protein